MGGTPLKNVGFDVPTSREGDVDGVKKIKEEKRGRENFTGSILETG